MIRLRRVKIDKDIERKIIIAMIVSTPFCQKIRTLFKYEYFELDYAKKITKWVWEYFDQYGKAPGVHIQDIYDTEKGELKEAEQNLVEYFLESLSEEFKKEGLLNEDYLVDETRHYFKRRDVENFSDRIRFCVVKGKIDKALNYVKNYEGLVNGGLKDRLLETMVYGDEFVSAEIEKPPIFISPWLTQGSITMIYGPRGLGKTWLAMIIAVSLTRENASEIEIGPWKTLRSAGVLFVDGEMEESMLQERVKILSSALGEEDLRNPLVLLSAHRYVKDHSKSEISLTADEFRDTIFNILNEREEIKVMILDNLSALATGIDENLKKEWDPINQWLISLRHLGVSVIYIHHSGKDPRKQRGTSGREDALDNVINLSRPQMYLPDMGAWFTIHFEKARGVPPGFGLKSFSLRVLEKPTEDGLIWEIGDVPAQENNMPSLIKGLLLEGELKNKKIAEKTGKTPSRVSQIKKILVESNFLDKNGVCTEKGNKALKTIKQALIGNEDGDLISYFEEN